MSLYVAICCDTYVASKLTSLSEVVSYCENYTLANGSKVTKAVVKRDLKTGSLWLYDYDDDQQNELSDRVFVSSADTSLRIQKI